MISEELDRVRKKLRDREREYRKLADAFHEKGAPETAQRFIHKAETMDEACKILLENARTFVDLRYIGPVYRDVKFVDHKKVKG